MPKKIKYVDWWKDFDPKNNFLQQSIDAAKCETELSEEPEYLICGVFGHEAINKKYDNCVKIFFTGENICPDFNLYDYAIGFEYLDFGDRYLRWPLYYAYGQELWELMMSKHINPQEKLAKKTGFCSFVYSNGKSDPIREQFFRTLSEYKKVDSGGRYMNNIGLPEGVKDKIEFESQHKFSIAFENSSHPGYTTEKLVQSFAAGTVPIYWGDPRVKEVFNPESFIFVNDFDSLDAVVYKIKEINQNDELYLKYLGTPALIDSEISDREKQLLQLASFFYSIFNQDKECAFRRNRECRGELYLNEIRSALQAEQDLKNLENRSLAETIVCTLRKKCFSNFLNKRKIS